MRHLAPSHSSERLRVYPDGSTVSPTAMQRFAEGQETPAKRLELADRSIGVLITRHLTPFHASARVNDAPEYPTAMH